MWRNPGKWREVEQLKVFPIKKTRSKTIKFCCIQHCQRGKMFHFSLVMHFKHKPFNSKMFYFYFWNVQFQLSEASFSFFFFIFLIFKNHFASNKRKRFSTLCSYLNIHVVYELRRVIKWWRRRKKRWWTMNDGWMDDWLTDTAGYNSPRHQSDSLATSVTSLGIDRM